MSSNRTTRNVIGEVARNDLEFGHIDEFGRTVGGWYQVNQVEFREPTAEQLTDRWFSGYSHPAGTFFELHFGNSRNGNSYQATKHHRGTLLTMAEAQAIGERKLADMAKRYARKYRQPATA